MQPEKARPERLLAARIVKTLSAPESEAIRSWAGSLLALRATQLSSADKVTTAIALTARNERVLPAVRRLGDDARALMWSETGSNCALSLRMATTGAPLRRRPGLASPVPNPVATLGAAIGVPPWIVIGGGATLVQAMLDELDAAQEGVDRNVDEGALALA